VLGIYSKKNNELTIVDIESIFSMNQKVKRIESENTSNIKLDAVPMQDKNNYIANKLQLCKDFGTTKAKKAMSNMESNMISDENISSITAIQNIITQNAINQGLDLKVKPEEQLEAKIEKMRDMLPPFNLSTEDVECIFDQDTSNY
jgi:hypothetical protein